MAKLLKWPQSLPFSHPLILAWRIGLCHHSGVLSQCWSREAWLQPACLLLVCLFFFPHFIYKFGFIGSTWFCSQESWFWASPWVPVLLAWLTCNCPGSLSFIVAGLFLSNPKAMILNQILLPCLGTWHLIQTTCPLPIYLKITLSQAYFNHTQFIFPPSR